LAEREMSPGLAGVWLSMFGIDVVAVFEFEFIEASFRWLRVGGSALGDLLLSNILCIENIFVKKILFKRSVE
jgi:hypothetical protein